MTDVFKKMINVLEQVEIKEYHPLINECENLYKSVEVKVGMWGEFSSGKSSFLNGLIGEEFFPVNITETTAMVTELRYGENKRLGMITREREHVFPYSQELAFIVLTRTVSFDDLKPTVKKKLDENNYREMSDLLKKEGIILEGEDPFGTLMKVVIYYPFDILKEGFVFVDLPGLKGSTQHTLVALNEIRNCSIVIYFKGSNTPVNMYDKEVLEDLRKASDNVLLYTVLNKVDLEMRDHFDHLHDRSKIEEIRLEILKKLKNELHGVLAFHEYFAISPLMMLYLKTAKGDEKIAYQEIKKSHENKFRFLQEHHCYEAISGTNHFESIFYNSLKQQKEASKKRIIEHRLLGVVKKIEEAISTREKLLLSEKELSQTEYQDAVRSLERYKKEYELLIDYGPKVESAIIPLISQYLSENLDHCVEQGLSACLKKSYKNEAELKEDWGSQIERSLINLIQVEKKERFASILNTGINELQTAIDKLKQKIDDITDSFMSKKVPEGVRGKVSLDDVNLSSHVHVTFDKDDQISAIAVGADALMLAADVHSFGVFTLFRLAFAGFESCNKGGTFFGGVAQCLGNFLEAIFSIFESEESKQLKKVQAIFQHLNDPSNRKKIVIQTAQTITPSLKDALAVTVVKLIEESGRFDDQIKVLASSIEAAKKYADEKFNSKKKTEEEKRIQINIVNNGKDEFRKLVAMVQRL